MKKTLSVPEVLADQKGWDNRYLQSVIHSIEISDNDPREKEALIEQFLSRETRGSFKATNPYSKQIFLPLLMEKLLEAIGPPRPSESLEIKPGEFTTIPMEMLLRAQNTVFVHVTFTDQAWSTCDRNIQFDLAKAKQRIRNALGGTNFLGRFEAAIYNNVNHTHHGVEGKLVLFHCHVLAWANNISKLRRVREHMHHRFTPPSGSKTSVKMQKVPREEVPAVVGYISKLPNLGYRKVEVESGTTQVKARLRPSSHYRFFKAMTDYSMFDFWLTSGEGREPLRSARHLAKLAASYGPRILRSLNKGPNIADRRVPQVHNKPRAPRYRWGNGRS